jgi:nitrate/nitrite transport system permease protein
MVTVFLVVVFLLAWHLATMRAPFNAKGLTDEQLQMMEFNGDIVHAPDGTYAWNPEKEKVKGIPGPLAVMEKAREELSEAFVKKGTNDHGIAYLVMYTVSRFGAGFLAASVVAVVLGVFLGLNKVLFKAVNPFIQILKPISPLAWMPLLLYTVKDPKWTAILVVFMAALWPTLATTAFGVNGIRKDSCPGSSGCLRSSSPAPRRRSSTDSAFRSAARWSRSCRLKCCWESWGSGI